MFLNLFADKSYLYKLFVTLLIIFISTLILMIIATLISIPLFDISLGDISNIDFNDKKNVNLLKFLQATQSIAMFIIPPILLAILFSTKPKKYLSLNKTPFLISAISVSFIMIFSVPIINYLVEINSNMVLPESLSSLENKIREMEAEAKMITELFLASENIGVLLLNIFIIAIIPAIGEELLFRGVFQRILIKWSKNVHIGVWVVAILFSAWHMQFYSFLARLVMGAMLGYMLVISKNLWLPIIAHFVNNTMGVIAYYLADKNIINSNTDTIGTGQNGYISLIVGGFVVVSLFYILLKYEKERLKI